MKRWASSRKPVFANTSGGLTAHTTDRYSVLIVVAVRHPECDETNETNSYKKADRGTRRCPRGIRTPKATRGGDPLDAGKWQNQRAMETIVQAAVGRRVRNRFDRMEWAGAFGDLGTLIPFVIAYVATLKLDPSAVLLPFGLAMIASGLLYRTPFPAQPMKAIAAVATTQAAQTFTVTAGAIYASSLMTGVLWLVLGLTGLAGRIAALISKPVLQGLILGLSIGFMVTATGMMAQNGWLAAAALLVSLILLNSRRFPAMFFLLLFGAACGVWLGPPVAETWTSVGIGVHLPRLAIGEIKWADLVIGTAFLALPQVPLTLGNAVVAITEENNRLFPERRVSHRRVAVSTGLMNLGSGILGGVPMCHGAGGMAGHVQFGARTGGAPIILGTIFVVMSILFGPSIALVLQVFPTAVLGVILFLTGARFAMGACDISEDNGERFATVVTAALAIWNVAIAVLMGYALHFAASRRWIRL
jgi:hypothetical protein